MASIPLFMWIRDVRKRNTHGLSAIEYITQEARNYSLRPVPFGPIWHSRPADIAYDICKRITRDKPLCADEYNSVVSRVANRVSGNPGLTRKALFVRQRNFCDCLQCQDIYVFKGKANYASKACAYRAVDEAETDGERFCLLSSRPWEVCVAISRGRIKDENTRFELFHVSGKFTRLHWCSRCGKAGTSRKVCWRHGCGEWSATGKSAILCMSCWNKIRPVMKAEQQIKELSRATRKLQKEISNVRKERNQVNR